MNYRPELKDALLRRMLPPNNESITKISREEGISEQTLRNWRDKARKDGYAAPGAIIYSISETAKANGLKPYEYFEYLLTEIPKHQDESSTDFLADLLPWSEKLPEYIRKPKKASEK